MNTVNAFDVSTQSETTIRQKAAWQRFLDAMLSYASEREEDELLSEIIRQGLDVYLHLPGSRSASLYLLDKNTYEFHHSVSIPEPADKRVEELFSRLVDQGAIAWALESGHASLSLSSNLPSAPLDTHKGDHALIVSLGVPSNVIGLAIIFLDAPVDSLEHMLLRLCLLHSRQFGYVLNNATLFRQIRNQQAVLEQKVAARTQSLEQARRELQMAAQRLGEAKEEAERANRLKTTFLSNMSHEIRTPMNGVLGMLDMALLTELTATQRDYLATARSSAQSLLALINDVLDLAKIESGSFEFSPVGFDLRELIELVGQTTAHRAHVKGVELVCMIDDDVPVKVVGDEMWLRQILVNLVGNAVKFTEQGEVVVRAECLKTNAGRARLRFSVTDTGIGISPENQTRIFESFSQADNSITRKFGGTGLGLTICRQLCERLGSRVELESQIGRGSRFWFDVDTDLQPAQDGSTPSLPEGTRVLIADDNRTAGDNLERIVARWGGDPRLAREGSAAERLATEAATAGRPFDYVLFDPALKGFEQSSETWGERLRKAAGQRARLIAMVQPGRARIDWKAVDRTCDVCVQKPLRRAALLKALRLAPEGEPEGVPTAAPAASAALQGARILLVEDNEINRKVVTSMLGGAGCLIDEVETGLQAIGALERKMYDVILMDIQMPEMDGLTATREIRKRPEWAKAPIIALSAHAFAEERHASLEAGMNDYLTKPIDRKALIERLIHWLTQRPGGRTPAQAAQAAGAAPASSPTPAPSPSQNASLKAVSPSASQTSAFGPSLAPPASAPTGTGPSYAPPEEERPCDEAEALGRVGGSRDLLEELLGMLDRKLDEVLPELAASIEAADCDKVRKIAHQLKGASANLSAHPIRDTAANLERKGQMGDIEGIKASLPTLEREVTRFKAYFKAR